jgi:hypothetical protein
MTDNEIAEAITANDLQEEWDGHVRAGKHHSLSDFAARMLAIDWLRSWLAQREEKNREAVG